MDSGGKKAAQVGIVIAVGLVLLVFGYVMSDAGYKVLRDWPKVSALFAACGVLWSVAGPAMVVAGLWFLGSAGRHRPPLWIGGAAALLAGVVLVGGVLTYVVPCTGPS